MTTLLDIRGLSVHFTVYAAGLAQKRLTVLSDMDVDVRAGEVVAVVGASGSGKSLLAHAVLGVLPPNATTGGEMRFEGQPLTERRKAELRGKQIALVPQSVAWLDPLMRVGPQVRRAAELSGKPRADAELATVRAFERYRLPPETHERYPFQLSGGMARRVLVSTAVVGQARLVIADEPTPGLHPDVVAETLGHLRELADAGRGVLLITHDITAALSVADRVAVFYAGTTVEIAQAADFAAGPQALRHPYSQALWRALPEHGFTPLAGAQPPSDDLPPGCLFEPRCAMATAACGVERPAARAVRGGMVRCIHAEG
jgi:peptide/nickel transport system ATP-binding protein